MNGKMLWPDKVIRQNTLNPIFQNVISGVMLRPDKRIWRVIWELYKSLKDLFKKVHEHILRDRMVSQAF